MTCGIRNSKCGAWRNGVADQKSQVNSLKPYWTLGFSLSVLPLLARAGRVYRRVPQLPAQGCTAGVDLPSLSIIVPARNEAHNLCRLLPSLEAQNYAGDLEIIVVDDHSTDGTAEIVAYSARGEERGVAVRLIPAPLLPEGWLGKPNASHSGACAAHGEWLLFTDADTEHTAVSAASAVIFAEANNLDGLSVFPKQETRGVMDSAVLMVAFAGLFAGLRRSTTMLNGQYVLVRREVYETSGGFAAVRGEMMDDLAFGKLLAEQGYRAPMMRGDAVASVHMYDDVRQMWRGVKRLGSGSLRYNGIMALVSAVFITGVMMPLWTLLFNRRYIRDIPRLRWIWVSGIVGFIPWARNFSGQSGAAAKWRGGQAALMAPAAAFFVQAAAVWGMVSRLLGRGVSWKGRNV